MDKIDQYRSIIKNILQEDVKIKPAHGNIEPVIVFDDERNSYQLMYIGWDGHRRVHASIIHTRLRDDKIWIEFDGTEDGIAEALVEAGIPKEDIVLAFHSMQKRKFTEFAVS